MFPLSHMMKTFIQTGRLEVIDADGTRHVFEGKPGPKVVMRLSDKKLYRDLVFKSEIAAAEACLLYTSPSPRDQRGARMPSSA